MIGIGISAYIKTEREYTETVLFTLDMLDRANATDSYLDLFSTASARSKTVELLRSDRAAKIGKGSRRRIAAVDPSEREFIEEMRMLEKLPLPVSANDRSVS